MPFISNGLFGKKIREHTTTIGKGNDETTMGTTKNKDKMGQNQMHSNVLLCGRQSVGGADGNTENDDRPEQVSLVKASKD